MPLLLILIFHGELPTYYLLGDIMKCKARYAEGSEGCYAERGMQRDAEKIPRTIAASQRFFATEKSEGS